MPINSFDCIIVNSFLNIPQSSSNAYWNALEFFKYANVSFAFSPVTINCSISIKFQLHFENNSTWSLSMYKIQRLKFPVQIQNPSKDILISQLCEVMMNINKASQSDYHKFNGVYGFCWVKSLEIHLFKSSVYVLVLQCCVRVDCYSAIPKRSEHQSVRLRTKPIGNKHIHECANQTHKVYGPFSWE